MRIQKSGFTLSFSIFLFALAQLEGCGFSQFKAPPAPASVSIPTVTAVSPVTLNLSVQPAALQILAVHCQSCHETENMGGLNSILDPNHLLQQGLVVPGNPGGSLLVQYVAQGLMPPSGPLGTSDVATLQTWVQGTPLKPALNGITD